MDLSPTDEQQHLAEIVGRFLTKSSSPERVRAAEPAGFDGAVWDGFVEMGVVAMGLPESAGGADAALADLAVVAKEAGAALAPAPIVEAMVAARLLARCPGADPAWLEAVVGGTTVLTVAVRPAVDGRATLVPGAAVADAALVLDGERLVLTPTLAKGHGVANLATAPLADIDVRSHDPIELAAGHEATQAFADAVDEWRALTAVWLVGLAGRALEVGTTYVIDRKQFDVPIGSFQAVQQRLADVATAVDGADLLAAKAIWALDEHEPFAARFASMAFAQAGEAAEASASAALHFHGGYGFMEEYDIQLYFRRAKATRLLLGDPRRELQLLADRAFPDGAAPDTTRTDLEPLDPTVARRGPEFRLTPSEEGFRRQVRTMFREHVTPELIAQAHETGTMHDWGLHKAMAEQGWISAAWPTDVGGQGRSPLEMNALSEEMYLSGAPVDGIGISMLVANTLLIEGTDWQKATVIPELISGEKLCCLGYSEPDAGSDVAACATKAERDGDHWVINGQKMFTTLAHESGYVFLLTRTNLDVPKHQGLTMFVVPMELPGIDITPVHTMGGERTNITFYSDLHLDDRYRVGEVDGGWKVMMTALVFERNGSWYGELVRLLDHAVHWAAATTGADGRPLLADPLVRERLARAAIGNEVANLLGWRAAWLQSIGELPSVEGSMAKLWVTEHYQSAANDLIELLGADGVRQHGDPAAPADGWIEAVYRHCQVTTIYGGTSEIQRNIIAHAASASPGHADMAGTEPLVLVDHPQPHVALVTLNRPDRLNAMSIDLVIALHDAFEAVAAENDTRVAVLAGAGRAFCSGLDLKDYGLIPNIDGLTVGRIAQRSMRYYSKLVPAMRRMPQPVIAAVRGAYGGGMCLSLGAELRIAGESAVFNSTGIVNGLTSTELGASWLLPRLIGSAHANDIMFTGRRVDAHEALRMGLVSRVVPDDEVVGVALEMAGQMASYSPYGLAMTKDAVWASLEITSLDAAIEFEDRNQLMLGFTENLPEAIRSFDQDRPPVYTDEPRRDLFGR